MTRRRIDWFGVFVVVGVATAIVVGSLWTTLAVALIMVGWFLAGDW